MTQAYLNYFFKDKVSLEHFDMAIPEQHAQAKAWLEKVPQGYLYYPIVFVNDELRLVGSAEYYEVLAAVRELMPKEAAAS